MIERSVVIVVFDGVQSQEVTGPLEVFFNASRHAESVRGRPAYRITTASLGGEAVTTSSGLRIVPDADLRVLPDAHTLVLPGRLDPDEADPELLSWLVGVRAERIMAVCTGAFLLAEAGLLDGRRATTHWAYADSLRTRYPQVHVDAGPIFVKDGHIVTSAGVTAGIDLALALVEDDLGHDIALTIARWLVVFIRRTGSQAQFSTHLSAQAAVRRPLREIQQLIDNQPDADLSIPRLARLANLSPRQFARTFHAEFGLPPGRYVDKVRLETACRMLEDTTECVEQIAKACGYGTSETMRRAFLRSVQQSPREYRRRVLQIS